MESQEWIIVCNSTFSTFMRFFGPQIKGFDGVFKHLPFSTDPLSSPLSRWTSSLLNKPSAPSLVPGHSINVKSAGLVGRHGPQSKQPFMVAFFKASEVLLRSVRAANKRKNQNRNKSGSHQDSSRVSSVGGKIKPELQFCTESYGVVCCKSSSHSKCTLWYTLICSIKSSSRVSRIPQMFH